MSFRSPGKTGGRKFIHTGGYRDMSDEFVSRLPVYQAMRSKDFPGFLIVRCSRKDCPGTLADRPFLVAEREWLRPRRVQAIKDKRVTIIKGRVCPYCSKVGRAPRRSEIG